MRRFLPARGRGRVRAVGLSSWLGIVVVGKVEVDVDAALADLERLEVGRWITRQGRAVPGFWGRGRC